MLASNGENVPGRDLLHGSPFHILTTTPQDTSFQRPVIDGEAILVYSDASRSFVPVPKVWLRDHCQCTTCVHPDTKQRLLDTFSIPRDLAVKSCESDGAGIRVTWNDGHRSYYPLEWLAKSGRSNKSGERQGLSSLSLWGNEIKDNEPEVKYRDVMGSDQGVGEWLALLHRYGFCYVDGTPATPEATEELLGRIAFIRHTHYGGFWDFTSDLASKDTAYTSLGLEAHTDNTYFSDPAGLQMFHCLSHTDGEGGASLLVDGFQAAADLQREDPEAYDVLSTINVYTHASGNEGISIQPYRSFPVLQHDPLHHHLVQIRWNSSDRAAIDMPLEEVQTWYDAAA